MYLSLTSLTIQISCCFGFLGYEIFQGFDIETTLTPVHYETSTTSTIGHKKINEEVIRIGTPAATLPNTTIEPTPIPLPLPVKAPRFNCSEDEKPFNIGAYEVPTQMDLVLLIQKTLIRMFNRYHEKALCFLKDIQEATKATSDIEKKCHSYDRYHLDYRMCVKQVSNKCEIITKSLVISLERQRLDVSAFIEGTICNVTEMKADPVHLIKTLAMEEASLKFALPGFLRLLGACSVYCDKRFPLSKHHRPLRHMTDQDLVVKHFLTKKNYLQLIKDSK